MKSLTTNCCKELWGDNWSITDAGSVMAGWQARDFHNKRAVQQAQKEVEGLRRVKISASL